MKPFSKFSEVGVWGRSMGATTAVPTCRGTDVEWGWRPSEHDQMNMVELICFWCFGELCFSVRDGDLQLCLFFTLFGLLSMF